MDQSSATHSFCPVDQKALLLAFKGFSTSQFRILSFRESPETYKG